MAKIITFPGRTIITAEPTEKELLKGILRAFMVALGKERVVALAVELGDSKWTVLKELLGV